MVGGISLIWAIPIYVYGYLTDRRLVERSCTSGLRCIRTTRQPELEGAQRGLFAAISAQAAEHQLREARHLLEDRIASGKEYLERLAAHLRDTGLKVETEIEEGAVAEKIIEYAKEHDIDLVMMSTNGYGGIKRRLLGSVTDRVIRASETPVLVLPAD